MLGTAQLQLFPPQIQTQGWRSGRQFPLGFVNCKARPRDTSGAFFTLTPLTQSMGNAPAASTSEQPQQLPCAIGTVATSKPSSLAGFLQKEHPGEKHPT